MRGASLGLICNDHLDQLIGTNLSGPWYFNFAFVSNMGLRRWGRIVSGYNELFTKFKSMFHSYSPAKAGL